MSIRDVADKYYMVWFLKISLAFIFIASPLLTYAQTENPIKYSSFEWYQLRGEDQNTKKQPFFDMEATFSGVHNDALIIAGGAFLPVEEQTAKIYQNKIWIATRSQGSDLNDDDKITPDERPLSWQESHLTLPDNRAYGASASHELGMIAIGGTDGNSGKNDVFLIRWNDDEKKTSLLQLPSLPTISIDGAASVIGDILYVMVGRNAIKATADLYKFDLSRIQLDDDDNPLTDGNIVKINERLDAQGNKLNPWQQLPSLPTVDGKSMARTNMALDVQYDGYDNRLYIIGGRGSSALSQQQDYSDIWAYYPDEKPVWVQKKDININGEKIALSSGASISLSQSHILVFTNEDQDNKRSILSYNTITNAWAFYGAEQQVFPAIGKNSVNNAAPARAFWWSEDIILLNTDRAMQSHPVNISTIIVKGPSHDFAWQNITVLVVYLMLIMLIGVYFAFQNKNTNDYFRGGQHIPWWATACSIYATMLSSLTYVAIPALAYRTDWLIFAGTLMILAVAPIAIYIAMPFFRQIDATSAYEYLSKRFNMPVRLFASALFTLFHIGRIGIVLALTALALAAITPLEAWHSVAIMGILSLLYCTLGGIEAVIWTDTIQTVVLFLGAIICFYIIIGGVDNGFSGFISAGMADNKFRMVDLDFSASSIQTWSLWVIIIGGIGQNISSYTADQAVVQRYMTTKDTAAAAKSIWANGFMVIPSGLLFLGIGTGLYNFYQSHPEKLDPTIQIDQIFPAFIATELPIGIAGLIIAGIFSAAQSTVSTSINSIATTLVTDFMRPFKLCRDELSYLKAARVATFLVGLFGTFIGLLFISPEIRSLIEEYYKVVGMFMGALGGLFMLGMMTEKTNGRGALLGVFVGVGVMVITWLMEWADGYLFGTIGIIISMLVGYFASFILPSDNHDINGLTLYTMNNTREKNTS